MSTLDASALALAHTNYPAASTIHAPRDARVTPRDTTRDSYGALARANALIPSASPRRVAIERIMRNRKRDGVTLTYRQAAAILDARLARRVHKGATFTH